MEGGRFAGWSIVFDQVVVDVIHELCVIESNSQRPGRCHGEGLTDQFVATTAEDHDHLGTSSDLELVIGLNRLHALDPLDEARSIGQKREDRFRRAVDLDLGFGICHVASTTEHHHHSHKHDE